MEVELSGILEVRVFIEHTRLEEILVVVFSCRANQAVFEMVCGIWDGIEICAEFVAPVAINDAVDDVAAERNGVCV